MKKYAGLTFTDALMKIWEQTIEEPQPYHQHSRSFRGTQNTEPTQLPKEMAKAGLLLIGVQRGRNAGPHHFEGCGQNGGFDEVICNPGPDYIVGPNDKGILLAPDEGAAQNLVNGEYDGVGIGFTSVEKHLTSLVGTRGKPAPQQHNNRFQQGGWEDDDLQKVGDTATPFGVHVFERAFVKKDLTGHILICDCQGMHIGQLLSHIMGYRLHPRNIPHIVLLTERHGQTWEREWERSLLSLARRHSSQITIDADHVTIIRGSALHIEDLERAGCRTASCVVVLGSEGAESESGESGSVLKDAETVKMFSLVRRMCPNAYSVVELKDEMNMVYLDPTDWWPSEGSDIGKSIAVMTTFLLYRL
jgi:hypothetical protein